MRFSTLNTCMITPDGGWPFRCLQHFPSSCNIRLQEWELCHSIKLQKDFKFCSLIGSHGWCCCNRKLQELGKALYWLHSRVTQTWVSIWEIVVNVSVDHRLYQEEGESIYCADDSCFGIMEFPWGVTQTEELVRNIIAYQHRSESH